MAAPQTALAAIGPGFEPGTYVATVTADSVNINKSRDGEDVLLTAKSGDTYEVLEDMGNGWMKVRVLDTEGYMPVSGNATVEEVAGEEMAEIQQEALTSSNSYRRQQVVDYALQFVGGRYRYGGSDPHSGVDCSGFTRYVLQNAAGVGMSRSSGSQAAQGSAISADQMQPGDLLFYGNGRRINHVAMYIGNGQIVHASTEQTGITISPWNYRTPVKITSVLG
ncbi:NlpC/P60 family protein [[Clostridium] asparagiforme DSM 15981]|uniref:NlpC/P60 family protein n=2 Tax=Enterocloster asparagiformis TaxID=333367 RepID=C0CWJ3_9FIRM|nr:NlpC/P60 family protein [[Clostridium] asparagiforme DSM 15981]